MAPAPRLRPVSLGCAHYHVEDNSLSDGLHTVPLALNGRCQHEGCYNHPIHERVITRIMDIVGLPQVHRLQEGGWGPVQL